MLRFVCVRQQFVVRGDVGGRLCCHLPLLFDPVVDVTKPYFSSSLTVAKMGWTREPFQNGKAQYCWPPRNNKFRSATFVNPNIVYFFTEQSIFLRRSTVLTLPLSVSVPWCGVQASLMLGVYTNRETKKFCHLQ